MLRSVRNNNPGNIDRGEIHWQGLMPADKMTPEQKIEPRFEVFENPAWGFRALCVVLHTYWQHDHCRTIKDIVSRWAPPGENNTQAYIDDVSAKTRIDQMVQLDLNDAGTLTSLARAIASHEAAGSLPYAQSFYPWWKDADLEWGAHAALAR